VAVIGTVTELDMVLQFMNYKGNLTDLGSPEGRSGRRNKKFHARDKKFSANILFNRG